MKVALVTDLHWGARDGSVVLLEHFRKFYNEVFFPYLDEHGINRVVLLGDTFDRRKFTNHVCLFHAKEILFNELAKRNIQTDVIVGNHDAPYKNTIVVNSPRLFLSDYNNLNIIDEPQEVLLGETKVLMVPWICPDNYEQTMDLLNTTTAQVAFGHFEFNGFEMHRGSVSEGYSTDIANRFDMVCSGHYHHKSSRGNIHYLGSPYEMVWSDYDDPRGFHIFDTETRSIEYIQNPFHLFYRVVYDDKDKEMDAILNVDLTYIQDCYVKLLVKNKTNPYWFDLFVEKIEKIGVADLQIIEDSSDLELTPEEELAQVETTLSLIKRYTASFMQEKDESELNELNGLMNSLYDEALSLGIDAE